MAGRKLIYCSRTHTQIKQIVREIKKTVYRPKLMVLASRDQMCINQDVKGLPRYAQRATCHFLGLTCPYHRNVNSDIISDLFHVEPPRERELMDIEDLYAYGKRRNVGLGLACEIGLSLLHCAPRSVYDRIGASPHAVQLHNGLSHPIAIESRSPRMRCNHRRSAQHRQNQPESSAIGLVLLRKLVV